jgi:hypothetical protein
LPREKRDDSAIAKKKLLAAKSKRAATAKIAMGGVSCSVIQRQNGISLMIPGAENNLSFALIRACYLCERWNV